MLQVPATGAPRESFTSWRAVGWRVFEGWVKNASFMLCATAKHWRRGVAHSRALEGVCIRSLGRDLTVRFAHSLNGGAFRLRAD